MDLSSQPSADRARPALWNSLPEIPLPTARRLRHNLPAAEVPPGRDAAGYDLLRTRAMAAMAEQGWRRLGIIQPRAGTSAALTALNLALSIARRPSLTVLLADLDLGAPRIAGLLGMSRAPALGQAIRGSAALAPLTRRVGANLAVLPGARPDPFPAETLQEPACAAALDGLVRALQPDISIILLPPMLDGDAGISALRLVDTSLLVLDGRSTVPADVRRCDRINDDGTNVLGLFLHNAEI